MKRPPSAILSAVTTAPAFFNPSVGQRASVSFTAGLPGHVVVAILDRDRFVVRTLARTSIRAGRTTVVWDGKDDAGQIVPDEAYVFRITFEGTHAADVYESSRDDNATPQELTSCTYSRTEGILSYTLAWPARVHILAGQAVQDPATHETKGPVLKTVVDRQPRAAGTVVESWNGLDETGTVFVPDLPHFVVAATATPLPRDSVIAVGNRKTTFVDYALAHRSKAALEPRRRARATARHYMGLNAIEDRNPALRCRVALAFDRDLRAYRVNRAPMDLTLALDPLAARYFLTPSAELCIFLDEKLILTRTARRSSIRVSVPSELIPPGRHRLVIDWAAGRGPIAVTTVVIDGGTAAPMQGPVKQ